MSLSSQECSIESYQGAVAHGWIVSVVGHAVLATGLLMSYSVRPITSPQESFRWNVQVVTSATAGLPKPEAPTAPAESPMKKAASSARSSKGSIEEAPSSVPQRIERKPLMERRPVETSAVRAEQPGQEPVRQEHMLPSMIDHPSFEYAPVHADEQMESRVSEIVRREPSTREQSLSSVMESNEPIVRSAAIHGPAVVTRPVAPVATMTRSQEVEASSESSGAVMPTVGLVGSSASGGSEASVPASQSDLSSTNSDQVPAPSESAEKIVMDRSQGTNAGMGEGSMPVSRLSSGESKRSDYGWLAAALRTRIEEIKSYSTEARTHEWEGRVVVAASVKADGRLVDIRVVESSGNGYLDEDAKQMVHYASPMTLSQPLGSAQVTVKVPIVFGLQ